MLSLPIALTSAIGVFAPVFSRPMWQHVTVLITGAVLAPGQRTVPAILRIMGRSAAPNFQTYHRVLNRAVWSPLHASRLLLRLLEAVWKQSLYKVRSYAIGRARPRTDLLDNRSLAMLLEISKRLIY